MFLRCAACRISLHKNALACGGCGLVVYCTNTCADLDWPKHARHCTDVMNLVLAPNGGHKGGLFVGTIEALRVLGAYDIDAVVTVLGDYYHEDAMFQDQMRKWIGVRPWRWYVHDDEPDEAIRLSFAESAAFIESQILAGRNVLVHCHAGRSRSVTLTIYYMMRYRHFQTPEEALHYIRRSRPCASPNEGFWAQLIRFGQE